jgi:hypothetical protein
MESQQSYSAVPFSGHDRRRLAKAMPSASEPYLFQRAPAVLRVAEGYPMTEAASLAGVDRARVDRGRRETGRLETLRI